MTLPPLDARPRAAISSARFAGQPRARRRRRDARSLHRRPRDAHLARGAGAGRPVPVASTCGSAAPPTSRTTSPRSAASASLVGVVGARRAPPTRLREQLARGRHRRRRPRRGSRPADDREGADRHRAQPAGGAHRLRAATPTPAATSSARSSSAIDALGARRERAARLGLPEGRRHAAGDRGAALARCERPSSAPVAAARRPEDPAPRAATPARRSSRRTTTRPKSRRTAASGPTTTRAQAARDFRDARAVRGGADHARRAGHVAVGAATPKASIPAVAREVSDVTGAGDTVVATLALALAAGATLAEAAVARQPRRRHRRRQVRPGDASRADELLASRSAIRLEA